MRPSRRNAIRRDANTNDAPDVARQKKFGIANAASEAQHLRVFMSSGQAENPLDQMRPEGSNGRPRKVLLSEAGVQALMVFPLPPQDGRDPIVLLYPGRAVLNVLGRVAGLPQLKQSYIVN